MRHPDGFHKLALAALIATSTLVIIVATAWVVRVVATRNTAQAAQSTNPADYALGGFPLSGQLAPDFTLTDQFGHTVTLSSLRGHEVVLAFIDARCKTLCPLTAQIMYNARAQLGATANGKIDLVAVNANPDATSVTEVQSWSISHGMLHQWEFLTGPASQLESIYHSYNVYDQVDASGNAQHEPITFIIDAQGHERLSFETLDSNNPADLKSQEIGLEAGMRQWLPRSQP